MKSCQPLQMKNTQQQAEPEPKRAKLVHLIKRADQLDERLMEAGDRLVVIGFFATWCCPCPIIGPVFEEISRKCGDKMVALRIDIDESQELAEKFTINALPTFVFYQKGLHLDTLTESDDDEKLRELIDKHLFVE